MCLNTSHCELCANKYLRGFIWKEIPSDNNTLAEKQDICNYYYRNN